MKLWNLDNGSIVIDHAQLMWNIGGGTPVRIPSYGVLIEHSDGLFLFDTGFDLEHTERVAAVRVPGADGRPDDPGTARALRLQAGGRRNAREHAPALRPRRRQQAPDQLARRPAREGASRTRATPSRSSSSATPTRAGTNEGARFEPVSGDLELAKASGCSRRPATRSATTRCS